MKVKATVGIAPSPDNPNLSRRWRQKSALLGRMEVAESHRVDQHRPGDRLPLENNLHSFNVTEINSLARKLLERNGAFRPLRVHMVGAGQLNAAASIAVAQVDVEGLVTFESFDGKCQIACVSDIDTADVRIPSGIGKSTLAQVCSDQTAERDQQAPVRLIMGASRGLLGRDCRGTRHEGSAGQVHIVKVTIIVIEIVDVDV